MACVGTLTMTASRLALPVALLAVAAAVETASGRQSVLLDGADWNFQLHEAQLADADAGAANQSGTIGVPGCWEAQGFGKQTVQMNHQVTTGDNAGGKQGAVGVYSKTVSLAPCSVKGARAVLTVDQVHAPGLSLL